jgi:hypothetical protein
VQRVERQHHERPVEQTEAGRERRDESEREVLGRHVVDVEVEGRERQALNEAERDVFDEVDSEA